MSSSCAEALSLLPGRPLDALEADERTFVAEHLAACAPCRERSQAIEGAFAALRRLEPAPAASGPDPLWDRIRSDLDRAPEKESPASGVQVTIALVCCFCHDGVVRADATYCASCLAPHHVDCFRAHGRCSAFGCDETRTVRPGVEPPKRRRILRFGLGVLLAGGLAGAAALTTYEVSERRHRAELARVEAEYHAKLAEVVMRIRAEMAERIAKEQPADQRPAAPVSGDSLEKQIDAVFARIEALMRDKDIDKLAPAFLELDDLMRSFGKPGTDEALRALKRWSAKLDEWKEVRLAIQLQIDITAGNEGLRAIIKARNDHDYEAGRAAYGRVLELVATMKREDREEFGRNADAIAVRASALMHELAASSVELSVSFDRLAPKEGVLSVPTGSSWMASRRDGKVALAVVIDDVEPAVVAIPEEAASDLLVSLKGLIAEKKRGHDASPGEGSAMETGIYTGVYGSDARFNALKLRRVSYKVLDGYVGVDKDGVKHVDPRITFVVVDTERSFWPLIVKMNVACAEQLAKEIEAALR